MTATLAAILRKHEPICVNLRDDADAAQWDLLLRGCGADLGCPAPRWLDARDDVVRWLGRKESVNLVVGKGVKWLPLIDHVRRAALPDLKVIDLDTGRPFTPVKEGKATVVKLEVPIVDQRQSAHIKITGALKDPEEPVTLRGG